MKKSQDISKPSKKSATKKKTNAQKPASVLVIPNKKVNQKKQITSDSVSVTNSLPGVKRFNVRSDKQKSNKVKKMSETTKCISEVKSDVGVPGTVAKDASDILSHKDVSKLKKKKQPVAKRSRTAGEMSSNWKALQKVLDISEKRKKKKPLVKKKQVEEIKAMQEDSSKPDIWFDDVDEILIQCSKPKPTATNTQWDSAKNPLVKPESFAGCTRCLAIDCEMVGVGDDGRDSILARVSIVNQFGQCLLDKYVQPTEPVTDYRTKYSGIRPADIEKGEQFSVVQKEVSDMILGKILVGHAIHNDLKVLYLDHPRKMIRDTSRFRPFRKVTQGGIPSLKRLAESLLGVPVQQGEHNSVQDAQAAMRLYTMYKKQWEKDIRTRHNKAKLLGKLRAAGKEAADEESS